VAPLSRTVLYPRVVLREASPKTISGRTRYPQTRLVFCSEPQLIPAVFNPHEFGPPGAFTLPSTWPWLDRLPSGLLRVTRRTFRTRFRFGSGPEALNLATRSNSRAHYAKGTRSGIPLAGHSPPTACKYMVSGLFHSPNRGAFHFSLTLLVRYRSPGST
jgi:hypothetical protein